MARRKSPRPAPARPAFRRHCLRAAASDARTRAPASCGKPALSPSTRRPRRAPDHMAIFKRPTLKVSRKKREIPQGLWQKCPGCSQVVHEIELAQNQRVCPHCDHHFYQAAKERVEQLLDPDSFVERDAHLRSEDTLQF